MFSSALDPELRWWKMQKKKKREKVNLFLIIFVVFLITNKLYAIIKSKWNHILTDAWKHITFIFYFFIFLKRFSLMFILISKWRGLRIFEKLLRRVRRLSKNIMSLLKWVWILINHYFLLKFWNTMANSTEVERQNFLASFKMIQWLEVGKPPSWSLRRRI